MRLIARPLGVFLKALGLASALLCLSVSPLSQYCGVGEVYAQTTQKKTNAKKTTRSSAKTTTKRTVAQKNNSKTAKNGIAV